MMYKLKLFFNNIIDRIYLSLSECDGMCNHCEFELKDKCDKRKLKL